MDGENDPNENCYHVDVDSNSINQDLKKRNSPDIKSNPSYCNNFETVSSSAEKQGPLHLEDCNLESISPLQNKKGITKEHGGNEKIHISTDFSNVTNVITSKLQRNYENTQQGHHMLNILETLNGPIINNDNNLFGNTLVRTNVSNEFAISNAGPNKMVSNESYSDDTSNKLHLKLDDSKNSQLLDPNLKQSKISKGNTNLLSNDTIDGLSKSIDSSAVETSLGNVCVVLSHNSLPPTGSFENNDNASLAQLKGYGSDGDESANETSNVVILDYREDKNQVEESDEGSDSDSSSSASKVISETETDSCEEYENYKNLGPCKPIRAKKELGLEDLPPIEDLKISVSEEDCILVGKVHQIVEQLVVVEALKGVPAYDLDTVLFLEGGQPLGKVFDVFGPVAEPYYCVRFNSRDHITEKNIHLNQKVFSAPNTKHTNYVFLPQLMKTKGSDASWVDDDEPPEGCLEYSDDEQEQRARKKKSRSGKATLSVESDPDEPARKKHFAYEERMNARNLQLTAAKRQPNLSKNKFQYSKNNFWSNTSLNASPGLSNGPNICRPPDFQNVPHHLFGRPPLFNKMALPFLPPLRSAMPFQNPSQSNFIQNTQPNISNPNSSLPFPEQISQWRPHCLNTGEPTNFGMNLSCPSPSTYNHSPVSSNSPGFIPNSSNWMRFPPIGPSSMSSPPPLRSPVVPNNSFSSPPIWTPQTKPPFPNTNSQTPSCNFPRNLMRPSFPPPSMSVQPSSQNLFPNNPLGVGFNPHVPPPRPCVNSFEIPPNISPPRVTFNSNIPPPNPIPTYRPIINPTNTSNELLHFNPNFPPPSQNSFKQ